MAKIRPANKDDYNFITATWLQSIAHPDMSWDVFKDFHNEAVKRILARAYTIVTADEDDPTLIHGWLCFERYDTRPVIHWAYTKTLYRGFGFFKTMMKQVVGDNRFYYTQKCKHNYSKGRYNPYLLFKESYDDNDN